MIEKYSEKLTKLQIKHPWYFLLIFGLITLSLIPGIFHLIDNVEPSLEKVLPQNIDEIKMMNTMRSEFGADMMYLIFYIDGPVQDVRDPTVLSYLNILKQKLVTQQYILDVSTTSDIILELNDGIISTDYELTKELLNLDPRSESFMNDDYSFVIVQIKSDTGASASVIKSVVNNIKDTINSIESYNPGLRYQLTGFNAIDNATFNIIMGDFQKITLVSMILIMLVVIFAFKRLGKAFIPMYGVMLALLWTMGVVGYIGFTITVVSMVASAMILGLGIDFGIHVLHGFFEERKKHSRKKSLINTMKELSRAMIAAGLTTSAGFLSLLFGVLPAMKNLGMILSIGIISCVVAVMFVLPPIIYLYDLKYSKTSNGEKK